MARSRATIFTSLWEPGSDFRNLSANAQRIYLMLLSLADLSLCGVIALTGRQWASMAKDTTEESVRDGLDELADTRYVVIDEAAEQVWVRTFTKHDGVLKQPNIIVAMSKDYCAIQSEPLREGFLEGLPEGLLEGLAQGYRERLAKPFVEGLLRVYARAPTSDFRLPTSDTTHSESPVTTEAVTSLAAGRKRSEAFEAEFNVCWEHYPRKIEKQAAFRAYKATRRRGILPDDLLAATKYFEVAMDRRAKDKIKHGATFFGPDQPWTDYVAGVPEGAAANGNGVQHPAENW